MVLSKSQNHRNLNDNGIGNNSAMKSFRSNLLWTPLLLTMAVALLTGCGGGGSGMGMGTGLQSGVFLDSAVQGLHYETATQSGVTGIDGTFAYREGETIRFYMGDVLIGQAPVEPFMTPVDLVPGATDETNPTVTNISRFLQTMDMDADPTNGIFIPESVITEMQGRHIDFNMSPQAFEMDADVSMLMDTMGAMDPAYAGRMMISAEAAQAHMGETLAGMPGDGGMMNGGNAGDGMPGGNGNVSNGGGMMNGGNVTNGGGMM